jgi:hypothetical protein
MSKKIITASIFVFATVLLLSIEFTVYSETESLSETVLIENAEVNQETCEKSIQISAFNDAKAFQVPGHEGGDDSTCDSVSCIISTECGATAQCLYRTTCDGCGCKIQQTGFGGTSKCGD